MATSGWYGVDLDGTLAHYSGNGHAEIGEPIPLMVERVKRWLSQGIEVRIFTARVSGDAETSRYFREKIEDWCLKHIGQKLPVTCCKDWSMITLYDDRAVHVEMNTGRIVEE